MARSRGDTSGELLVRVALGLALTGLAIVSLVPLVVPSDPAEDPTGTAVDTEERVTLVEREGPTALLSALALGTITAVPLALRRSRIFKAAQRAGAVTLVVGVLLTITSVGIFFAPSALLMVVAATRREPDHPLRPRG